MTVSHSPSALFPSSLKRRFPRERLEICTMKSAQLKHLQRLQRHRAPSLSALSVQGQHVFSHRHTTQPSPCDGEVTSSRETTPLGGLGHANMTEGGHANCCLYWPLIREMEQFPAIVSGTRGRGGRKRTTGQKSYRETDSFAMHS